MLEFLYHAVLESGETNFRVYITMRSLLPNQPFIGQYRTSAYYARVLYTENITMRDRLLRCEKLIEQ